MAIIKGASQPCFLSVLQIWIMTNGSVGGPHHQQEMQPEVLLAEPAPCCLDVQFSTAVSKLSLCFSVCCLGYFVSVLKDSVLHPSITNKELMSRPAKAALRGDVRVEVTLQGRLVWYLIVLACTPGNYRQCLAKAPCESNTGGGASVGFAPCTQP